MLKRTQEEESAATAEAESRRRLDEAKAAIAALEEETARLEMEKEAAQVCFLSFSLFYPTLHSHVPRE